MNTELRMIMCNVPGLWAMIALITFPVTMGKNNTGECLITNIIIERVMFFCSGLKMCKRVENGLDFRKLMSIDDVECFEFVMLSSIFFFFAIIYHSQIVFVSREMNASVLNSFYYFTSGFVNVCTVIIFAFF